MKNNEYLVSLFNPDERVVTIKRFEGVGKDYLLQDGVKLGDEFPQNAEFQICEDSGDMLTDFIDNIGRQVIINQKVKNYFVELGIKDDTVEYLPFSLKNKKGKLEKEQYYLVNPITLIECMDKEKSDFRLNSTGTKVRAVRRLHVITDKISEDALIFRLAEEPSRIILSGKLVEAIEKAGFTGLGLRKMGEEL